MDALFSRDRVEKVICALADRLSGDWLLIGGALVAVWLEPRRTTEDIDLVGIGGGANRMDLLGAAMDLGLPVEAVNSAADFFVERVPGWRDEIVPWHVGARGRIFRPTPTLLLLLKAPRLTDQDLADCFAALERSRADGLPLDATRVIEALANLPDGEAPTMERRAKLRAALDSASLRSG